MDFELSFIFQADVRSDYHHFVLKAGADLQEPTTLRTKRQIWPSHATLPTTKMEPLRLSGSRIPGVGRRSAEMADENRIG